MEIKLTDVVAKDLNDIRILAETVNEKHVAPLLNTEGKEALRVALKADVERVLDKTVYQAVKASCNNKLVGYIAWRDGNYLGQLYVDSSYHGCGIASKLVDEMKQRCDSNKITVKASIYALGFYQKVGFKALSEELNINGMRYVPMELEI
ncbi:hypothetical protein MACH09_42140 [Vibrio sp. MACH09]|uniref:GNAT family N-acetyltransferase n=1 Tax=Vibrio sp. MACH09 TaxID=3025122 RepID=UPI0027927532|nr:GNAT family N-acetyltransferase [Vibrio sp. MACH09]GLO63706.1 hypothetical protein MACH09_42140 [Vibrio sp. MACH09]